VWYDINPGRATVLPPDAVLEYRYRGLSTHACVHFSLGASEPSAPASIVRLPIMMELGESFAALNTQVESVIASLAASPLRASVRLWDLLWRLGEIAGASTASTDRRPAIPPVVTAVIERIELRLSEPLYVGDLADEAGLSHAHLTRLFHAATGGTIAAHIAHRRAERAADLLMHTTLPVKVIASQVGMPDLHQFNKSIRRLLGSSPRDVRRMAGGAVPATRSPTARG
jgi:AraC-like DNA-binding protein